MPRKPIDPTPARDRCRGVAFGILLSVPAFGLLAALVYWWRP